jgi:hypothetical protein
MIFDKGTRFLTDPLSLSLLIDSGQAVEPTRTCSGRG